MPFEDLAVWQRARRLAGNIYRLTADGQVARDFGLRDQLRRSAVSIVSNIAEGYERSTVKEFANFMIIAKGSAGELRAQLYLLADLDYLPSETALPLIAEVAEISRMIVGLIRSRQRSPK